MMIINESEGKSSLINSLLDEPRLARSVSTTASIVRSILIINRMVMGKHAHALLPSIGIDQQGMRTRLALKWST
jgi:hypothetical protein